MNDSGPDSNPDLHSNPDRHSNPDLQSNTGGSGIPLRALAMVLIALAVVFAGIGLVSLRGDDDATTSSGPIGSTSSLSTATSG